MLYCNNCGEKWMVHGREGVLKPNYSVTSFNTLLIESQCFSCGNYWLGGTTDNPYEYKKDTTDGTE